MTAGAARPLRGYVSGFSDARLISTIVSSAVVSAEEIPSAKRSTLKKPAMEKPRWRLLR